MLFIVLFKNSSFNDVENVKALVILVRMVLIIQLRAINERWKLAIKDLVPCRLEYIKYLGLVGDNPLAINFKGQRWNKEERNYKGIEQVEETSISGEGFSLVLYIGFI